MQLKKEEVQNIIVTLESKGYVRYKGHYKSEDYWYWKQFDVKYKDGDKSIGYQIAFLFYDFSKYPQYTNQHPIGIQYEFLLGNNKFVDRCDFLISDDRMTFDEFEKISKKFYTTIYKSMILNKTPIN